MGHSVHTCLIGMRLAEIADLPGDRGGLFYALLMKDLGCSSNAALAKNFFKLLLIGCMIGDSCCRIF